MRAKAGFKTKCAIYLSIFLLSLILVSTAAAAGSISGSVSYGGTQSGTIYVAVFTSTLSCSSNTLEPSSYIILPTLGSYTLSGLADGMYYVASVIQTCESCELQPTDPWGIYNGCANITAVAISGGNAVTGININLVDGTEDLPNPFSACAQYAQFAFQPLEFPFQTPIDIARMAAFGVPNWSGSEPHNGIDLIISESLASAKIISPANGTIESITVSENPYSNPPNQMLLSIQIHINCEWSVNLVIEPSTVDEQIKNAQIQAVQVQVGQVVSVGDEIADLLVGDLGYPHLHYMVTRNGQVLCAYNNSSGTAKAIFEDIATTRENNYLPDGNICYGPQCTDGDTDTYAIEGGSCGAIDCNDNDPAINPGATEICDRIDNNCNGQINEHCPSRKTKLRIMSE